MKTIIPDTKTLTFGDTLPLTCNRSGTCCFGKMVWLNPWELAQLAKEKGMTSLAFRDHYCEFGGIRLRFDGIANIKKQAACSMYLPNVGCSVHSGRPLVCRLYPLGRQRQNENICYIHQGNTFPCLEDCSTVLDLPQLTVENYLAGQDVTASEKAHDDYMEMMQHLADGAFALLIETGLAASGDKNTLRLWRILGKEEPEQLAKHLGKEWLNLLMLPDISHTQSDPASFCTKHHDMIQKQAQVSFGNIVEKAALGNASGLMMGLALHLGRGLGANPVDLSKHWIKAAKKLGANE